MTRSRISSTDAVWSQLIECLGPEHVLSEELAHQQYGADTTQARRRLAGALRPQNRQQLAELMPLAHHHRLQLHPISTGKNWGYGTALPASDGSFILDLSALNRIIELDAELGTVTVEPGVTQGQLAAHLDAHAPEFLVPVTGAGPHTSLMGNALERGFGFTRNCDHAASVLALEALMPDGSLFRSALSELGGTRVDKLYRWGLGPYIEGLFTQNGFGVVTQVTLALARRPECCASMILWIDDAQLEAAVKATRDILSTLPATVPSMKLMNNTILLANIGLPYPHEQVATGETMSHGLRATQCAQAKLSAWSGYITLYGSHESVRVARRVIRKRLRGIAHRAEFLSENRLKLAERVVPWLPRSVRGKVEDLLRTLRESMSLVRGRPSTVAIATLPYWRMPTQSGAQPIDPAKDRCGLIWYSPLVPMTGADVRNFNDLVHQVLPSYGLEPAVNFSALSERVFDATVPLLFDPAVPGASERAQAAYQHLLRAGQAKGFIPYRLGIDGMAWFRENAPTAAGFSQRIRSAFGNHDAMDVGRYSPLHPSEE